MGGRYGGRRGGRGHRGRDRDGRNDSHEDHGGGGRGRDHDSGEGEVSDRRRGRGGGGSQSTRLFDYGELRLVVLVLLSEQPRHGYEIIKEIEERTGGTYSPSPGVMYPTLSMLDELGQAKLSEDGGRKLYQITSDGEAYLSLNKVARDAALAQMERARATQTGIQAPKVVQAISHLDAVLRKVGERLTEDQTQAVVDIINMASLAIARIHSE